MGRGGARHSEGKAQYWSVVYWLPARLIAAWLSKKTCRAIVQIRTTTERRASACYFPSQVPAMRPYNTLFRRQAIRGLSTNRPFTCQSTHIMDINTGNVDFGRTCPGILMEDLRLNMPESVAKIRKLQTSLSRYRVPDLCALGCADLAIVRGFISSIGSLQELHVINYEPDASAIWSAIFQHAKSLRSLAIHSPPMIRSLVWTPTTTSQVIQGLPQLTRLELDIQLEEAESLLSPTDDAQQQQQQQQQPIQSVICKLAEAEQLESILINVNLPDSANIFADAHTWNAYGPTGFGLHHQEPRKQLTLKILDKMRSSKSQRSQLKHLVLRFPRRSYEDRCQFWTVASSVHASRDDKGIINLEVNERAKEYLPPWPEYGGILWNLMQ